MMNSSCLSKLMVLGIFFSPLAMQAMEQNNFNLRALEEYRKKSKQKYDDQKKEEERLAKKKEEERLVQEGKETVKKVETYADQFERKRKYPDPYPLQQNGMASLQFKASKYIANAEFCDKGNNAVPADTFIAEAIKNGYAKKLLEPVEILQKHKISEQNGEQNNDYKACLKEVVAAKEVDEKLVQELILETKFSQCDDTFKADVLLSALHANNIDLLLKLMKLVNIEDFGKLLVFLKPRIEALLKLSLPKFDRNDSCAKWTKSNRLLVEFYFELLLQEYIFSNPNKKRSDYKIKLKNEYNDINGIDIDYAVLMIAAQIGSLKHVQEFCDKSCIDKKHFAGYSYGFYGNIIPIVRTTVLYEACRSGNVDLVNFLLEQGADPLLCDNVFFWEGKESLPVKQCLYKALVGLCKNTEEYITKQFVDGKTLLFYALQSDDEQEVDALLKYGANVNHKDDDGRTPLFFCKDLKHVKKLVDNGADVMVYNKRGQTIYEFVDKDIALYLLEQTDELPFNKDVRHPLIHFLHSFYACGSDYFYDKNNLLKTAHIIISMINKTKNDDLDNNIAIERKTVAQYILSLDWQTECFMEKRKEILEALFKHGIKLTSNLFFRSTGFIYREDLDLLDKYGFDWNEGSSMLDFYTKNSLLSRLKKQFGCRVFCQKTGKCELLYEPIAEYIEKKTKNDQTAEEKNENKQEEATVVEETSKTSSPEHSSLISSAYSYVSNNKFKILCASATLGALAYFKLKK